MLTMLLIHHVTIKVVMWWPASTLLCVCVSPTHRLKALRGQYVRPNSFPFAQYGTINKLAWTLTTPEHTWTHTHTHTHTHAQSAALMITLWMCLAHIGPTDGRISVAYVLPLLFQWEQLKHITLLTTLFMQQLHSLPGGILFPFQNMQQTFLNTPIKISTTGYCCKTLLIKVMWNRNWVNYCIC